MSSGIHAAILSPHHVTVHTWEKIAAGQLPTWDPAHAAVLFPSKDAVPLAELPGWRNLKHVLVLESKVRSFSNQTLAVSACHSCFLKERDRGISGDYSLQR